MLNLKMGHQDSSRSHDCQGDMPYYFHGFTCDDMNNESFSGFHLEHAVTSHIMPDIPSYPIEYMFSFTLFLLW